MILPSGGSMPEHSKSDALRAEGTLNPRPEAVTDPKFREGEFFDPRDIVQVRYEMLRRVQTDEAPVTQAAAEFGFSRPTFYETQANFDQAGIAGLVPRKRGPRGPHKLSAEVLEFLQARVEPDQPIRARKLARDLLEQMGLEVHPRTIERVLSRKNPERGPHDSRRILRYARVSV
jgi:transposase